MSDCLLLIDVQRGFVTPETEFVVPRLKELAGMGFDHIVATKFVNKPSSPFVKHMGWRGMMSAPDTDLLDFVRDAAEGVEEKYGYSAVCQRINDFFHSNGVDTVYIAGMDTDCCVLKNAADFFDLGYDVTVLMWYTASNGGEESVRAARKVLSRMIGENCIVDGRLDRDLLRHSGQLTPIYGIMVSCCTSPSYMQYDSLSMRRYIGKS